MCTYFLFFLLELLFGEQEYLCTSIGCVSCFALPSYDFSGTLYEESFRVDAVLSDKLLLYSLGSFLAEEVIGEVGACVVAIACDECIGIGLVLHACSELLYRDEPLVGECSFSCCEIDEEIVAGSEHLGAIEIVVLNECVSTYEQDSVFPSYAIEESVVKDFLCDFFCSRNGFAERGQSFCFACEFCLFFSG